MPRLHAAGRLRGPAQPPPGQGPGLGSALPLGPSHGTQPERRVPGQKQEEEGPRTPVPACAFPAALPPCPRVKGPRKLEKGPHGHRMPDPQSTPSAASGSALTVLSVCE